MNTLLTRFGHALGPVASLFVLVMLVPPAAAEGTKTITLMPRNAVEPAKLTIDGVPATVLIGQEVQFCARAGQDGYISMWNRSTSGSIARLFPYTSDAEPVAIKAGERICAGSPSEKYAYIVAGPTGTEETYVLWTATRAEHPRTQQRSDARRFTKDINVLERIDRNRWSTATVSYRIVEAVKPRVQPAAPVGRIHSSPPPAPAAATAMVTPAPRTFVLAMGADTYGLTGTATDATRFAGHVQRIFNVPASQVRLVRQTWRRDFEAGMRWLRDTVRPQDVVFIMFSGHGITLPDDVDGEEADGLDEAFVTVDIEHTPRADRAHVVTDDDYARWVADIPSSNIISIIDACHAAGLSKGMPAGRPKMLLKALGDGPAVARIRDRPAVGDVGGLDRDRLRGVVLAAAREGELAVEAEDGGVWITALLQGLADPRAATLRDGFDLAAADARQRSGNQQTPQAAGDLSLLDLVRLR